MADGPRVAHHAFMASSNSVCTHLSGFLALTLVACSQVAPPAGSGADDADSGTQPDAALESSVPNEAGPPPGGTHVAGALAARGATFKTSRTTSGEYLLDIVLGDVADVCHTSRTNRFTKVLHLTLRSANAPSPGTFAIVRDTVMGGSGPAPQGTGVLWSISDVGPDLCSLDNQDQGSAGAVTLTKVTSDAIEGAVDITLANAAAKAQGTFVATSCVAPGRATLACPLAL